ncbi:MAG TPA: hypothetical protein VNA65_11210 [Candidatus Dormibacteraeota bacterium]|nr:hypothetical protein [Candidatus Dormibacteraeota bacterium]
MYGLLTQDIARAYVADREREISRMALEREAGAAAPRLHARLIAAAQRLRGSKARGVVRKPATSASN